MSASGNTSARPTVTNNQATNQSTARVTPNEPAAQATTGHAPLTEQVPTRAVAYVATEAKPEAQLVAAPSIEPANETPPAAAPTPAAPVNSIKASTGGNVTIQVGSYNESRQAEERVAGLKFAGFEARVVAVDLPKRGMWYRVQSGRFNNRDEAERYGKQLREKGVVSSFITTDVQQ